MGHGTRQCASEMVTSSYDYSNTKAKDKARAFHTCKMSLARQVFAYFSFFLKTTLQVQRLCDFTAVKSSGKLLYCYNRGCMSETWANLSNSISECQTFSGMITCCFDEHQCVKDWVEMQEHALDVARLVWTTKCHFRTSGSTSRTHRPTLRPS